MANTKEKLDEIFGGVEISQKKEIEEDKSEIVVVEENNIIVENRDKDISAARGHYKELIEVGTTAIDELSLVAESTNSPRAYEVLSKLIQNTGEIVEKSVKLHERKENKESETVNKGIVNNGIMVGSLSDITKVIENTNINKLEESDEITIKPIKVEVKDEQKEENPEDEIFKGLNDDDFKLSEEELGELSIKDARKIEAALKQKKEEWKEWKKNSKAT